MLSSMEMIYSNLYYLTSIKSAELVAIQLLIINQEKITAFSPITGMLSHLSSIADLMTSYLIYWKQITP